MDGQTFPAEANARLIAAAPELLEALKAIAGVCREGFGSSVQEWNAAFVTIKRGAVAAIAKAEGREP